MEIVKNRLQSFLFKLSVAFTGSLLILLREEVGEKISKALTVCADTLIPSLFPFMVLSSFALSYGIFEKETKLSSFVMQKIFRLPVAATTAVIFGFIGGYPVGARIICRLYEDDIINRDDAEHLFAFCVNGGPAFIIAVAGELVAGSQEAGYVMFASVLLSSLLTGIIYGRVKKKGNFALLKSVKKEKNISDSLVSAVIDASGGIVSVCAWVIAFTGFSAVAAHFFKNEYLYNIYLSLTEITSGLQSAALIGGIPFLSACIGFGGISVVCQVLPAIKKCGIKVYKYLFFRIVNGISSWFIASFIMKAADISVPTLSQFEAELHFAPASAVLLIMCAVLIADVTSDNEKQGVFG